MDGIRWIVEDALKFVRREARRGRRYDGIVLDPPAYGRGAAGEKWVLEEHINEMLSLCGELLAARGSFLVLNLYSMGLLRTAGPDGGPAARRRVLFGAVRRALLLRSFRQVASAGSLLPDVEAVTPGLSFSVRASACTQACGSETGGSGTAETAVICREGMCRTAGGQSCDDYVFYVPTTTGPCMYAVRFGRTLSGRSFDRSIRSRGSRNRHRYYGVYN